MIIPNVFRFPYKAKILKVKNELSGVFFKFSKSVKIVLSFEKKNIPTTSK